MDDFTTDPAETEIVRGVNAQFPIRPISAKTPDINKRYQLNSNEPISDEFHHVATGVKGPIVNSLDGASGSDGSNSYSQELRRAQEQYVSGNFIGAIKSCRVSINASDIYIYFTNWFTDVP